ncbi:MAG: NADH-quinone oxidoreductase subunit NuoH [Planctomycetes bacterium]|nr:NADH-quinone oxidoreductase subunit NuoH [Planctomycetota bacterium]
MGVTLIKVLCMLGVILGTVPIMLLMERKVSGWIQDRIGPNRAGPRGILQPLADGIKLLFKEDFTPAGVDKVLFVLAPCLAMLLAICAMAVIPFAGDLTVGDKVIPMQIARVDIGLLYVLGIGSLAVYGVVLGGWASNSKYAFLGGLRAAAQMLSYEVPLGLAVLSIVVLNGSLGLEKIVDQQIAGVWNIFLQPVTFVIFLVCVFAETNRLPFDLAECEQELVAGYHTEYSSMKFAMFFLGEYAHVIVASSMIVVLFFGGWHVPGMAVGPTGIGGMLLGMGVFYFKVWCFIFVYLWVRWTLPRFRYDQLMGLAWKGLVPLSLVMLLFNSVLVYFRKDLTPGSYQLWQLVCNLVLIGGVLVIAALRKTEVAAGNAPVDVSELGRGPEAAV